MADIRIALGFTKHPKTVKLRRRIGDTAIVALVDLWTWAAENRPTGVLDGMASEDIAIAACWDGDAETLVATLTELSWLDRDEAGTLSIHNWEKNQPWVFGKERRSEIARENARAGWKARKGNADGKQTASKSHADGMQPACEPHATGMQSSKIRNAPSPSPSPSPTTPLTPQGGPSDPHPKPSRKRRAAPSTYPPAFEEWWSAYPRREDKGKAFLCWQTWTEREGVPNDDLLAAAKHYAASRIGEDAKFTKLPATFLSLSAAPWRDWVKGPPEEPRTAPLRFDPYEPFQASGSVRAPEDDAPQQRRSSARWGLA